MPEQNLEDTIRTIVRQELAGFLGSSQYQFQKDAKFYDARNIQVGYTTGTKIGSDPNQKLALWGTTPVAQPALPLVPALADVVALLKAVGLSK